MRVVDMREIEEDHDDDDERRRERGTKGRRMSNHNDSCRQRERERDRRPTRRLLTRPSASPAPEKRGRGTQMLLFCSFLSPFLMMCTRFSPASLAHRQAHARSTSKERAVSAGGDSLRERGRGYASQSSAAEMRVICIALFSNSERARERPSARDSRRS